MQAKTSEKSSQIPQEKMQTLQPEGESCNNYYMLMVCLGILLENPKTLNIVTTFEHKF